MSLDLSQNPPMRRAYFIRPLPALFERLISLGLAEDAEFLAPPTVVMTEMLPFEGGLEGYRSLILNKCKEAFLNGLLEYEPLSDSSYRNRLLGEDLTLADCFDIWWAAEEVETIEIKRTW